MLSGTPKKAKKVSVWSEDSFKGRKRREVGGDSTTEEE